MDFLAYFFCQYLSSQLLPILMQNIGLALVTMLIPLVLFIFSMEKEKYLFEWDKIVILEKVIKAKRLLIAIGLIFFPLFFWDKALCPMKFILLIIFFLGVFYVIKVLFNSYHWIKTIEIEGSHDSNSFRNKLRNEYLGDVSNLKNLLEKEKVWLLSWREPIPNILDEINLTRKFIKNIDAFFKNNYIEVLARCLGNYNEFIEKRSLFNWVVFGDIFPKILEWHYIFFEKYNKYEEKDEKLCIALYEIESSLVQLVEKCVLSSLQKNTCFLFFKNLKTHTQGKNIKILKELFSRSVCSPFFNNIFYSNDRYDIWNHYFPKEWQITKETLEDKNNIISKIWIDTFFQWAPHRFRSTVTEKDFDDSLDEVAKELFPSVEPILWAELLTLLMRPWHNDERMKSFVEKEPNFGSGRIFVSSYTNGNYQVEFDKAFNEQRLATIEFILLLLKDSFNKDKLQKFISDLERLTYDDETRETRRKYFISIFQEMLSLLEKEKA